MTPEYLRLWCSIAILAGGFVSLFWEPNGLEVRATEGADALQGRLAAVYLRRKSGERGPFAARLSEAVALWLLGLIMLFTKADLGVAYAAFMLIGAFSQLHRYVRRRAPSRAAASLTTRSPVSVVPPYAFGIAGIAALSPLALTSTLRGPSWFVTAAASLVLAWKTAVSPARLAGIDLEVEVLVDDRTRAMRTVGMLSQVCFAAAAFYLFSSIEGVRSGWFALAYFGLIAPMAFFLYWGWRVARRVKPADLAVATLRHA